MKPQQGLEPNFDHKQVYFDDTSKRVSSGRSCLRILRGGGLKARGSAGGFGGGEGRENGGEGERGRGGGGRAVRTMQGVPRGRVFGWSPATLGGLAEWYRRHGINWNTEPEPKT